MVLYILDIHTQSDIINAYIILRDIVSLLSSTAIMQ